MSSEEYKNRDMKSKAFIDVAAVVVQNFEDLNEKEKEEAGRKLEKIRPSRYSMCIATDNRECVCVKVRNGLITSQFTNRKTKLGTVIQEKYTRRMTIFALLRLFTENSNKFKIFYLLVHIFILLIFVVKLFPHI